ncbi:MAG TPA: hypothetical protein VGX96_05525 [Candidatus Elarobacter sp.]|jgi:hypothetical protein|nr:hypothetical protein [Candidatus Elarobacter sp.]
MKDTTARRAIACAVALLALPVAATSAAAEFPTRVTTYVPVVPANGKVVAGSCWTRSIAAPTRSDTYRCMVSNAIYDPCFTPKRPGVAVCDVNPVAGGRGFALRLTKPLPDEPVFTGRAQPWLVQLADGEVCMPLTGTHEAIRGETILYECSGSRAPMNRMSGLIAGSFTAGTVWHVRQAVYQVGRSGQVSGTVRTVPVGAVWR